MFKRFSMALRGLSVDFNGFQSVQGAFQEFSRLSGAFQGCSRDLSSKEFQRVSEAFQRYTKGLKRVQG